MKIVIAGNGKVGGALTGQLVAEGHDLILIDSDSEALESGMEQYDIMSVQGNCASMETLRQAGIEDADLLIATTGSDEVNLLACMTAHALNRGLHTIARIRNPEYTDQAYMMKEHFALSMDFNPDRQTAIEIDRLLKYPGFLKRDAFADGRVEIVELRVDEKSKLCGTTLIRMIGIVKCKVLVCAVLRAGNESFEAVHRVEHFTVEVVEVFVRKAHAADHVVDGLDAKLARTFEAVALIVGLAVFNLCDEHDR